MNVLHVAALSCSSSITFYIYYVMFADDRMVSSSSSSQGSI